MTNQVMLAEQLSLLSLPVSSPDAAERCDRAFDALVASGWCNRLGYTRKEWARAGYRPDRWADAPEMGTKNWREACR